jgi:hypothetical protein
MVAIETIDSLNREVNSFYCESNPSCVKFVLKM